MVTEFLTEEEKKRRRRLGIPVLEDFEETPFGTFPRKPAPEPGLELEETPFGTFGRLPKPELGFEETPFGVFTPEGKKILQPSEIIPKDDFTTLFTKLYGVPSRDALTTFEKTLETSPVQFLIDLQKRGTRAEQEGFLRILGASEQDLDDIYGQVERQTDLDNMISQVFPKYRIEDVAKLLESQPDSFIEKVVAGERTQAKEDLLRELGFSWEKVVFPPLFQRALPLVVRARNAPAMVDYLLNNPESLRRNLIDAGRNADTEALVRAISPEITDKEMQDYFNPRVPFISGISETGLPAKTWLDKFNELWDNPAKLVPFVSSGVEIVELGKLMKSALDLENGKEVSKEDLLALKAYVDRASVDTTWAYETADVIAQLVPFALEFILTGGIFSAGKTATVKAGEQALKRIATRTGLKVLEGKLAKAGIEVSGVIAGGTLQTIPAGITRIPASALEKQLQATLTGEEESVWRSTLKALGEQWVETVSERTGGWFKPLTTPIKGQLTRLAMFKAFKAANPGRSANDIRRLIEKMGYNGVLGEMLEERVADVGKGILEPLGLSDQKFSIPSGRQLLTELVAFSVPGAAMKAIETTPALFEKLSPAAKEKMKRALTEERGELGGERPEVKAVTEDVWNISSEEAKKSWAKLAKLPEGITAQKWEALTTEQKESLQNIEIDLMVEEAMAKPPAPVTPTPEVTDAWKERTITIAGQKVKLGELFGKIEHGKPINVKPTGKGWYEITYEDNTVLTTNQAKTVEAARMVIETQKAIPKAEAVTPSAPAVEPAPQPVVAPEAQPQGVAPPAKPPVPPAAIPVSAPAPLTPVQKVREFYKAKIADIEATTREKIASLKDWAKYTVAEKSRVQNILTDYVQEQLPLAERGKLLDDVKNITSQADLNEVIARVDRISEQATQKLLRAQIVKELKRAQPRKVEGIVKGRFGGEIQAELDIMTRSLKMSRDDALAKIQANQQAYEDGKMSYEDMVRDNDRLNFTGIEGMTSDELQETLDYIKSLKEIGRSERIQELEKVKEVIAAAQKDIIQIVTGGEEVQPGVIKEFSPPAGFYNAVRGGNVTLTDFLDVLSGTDKTSKSYSSALNLFVDDRVLKSYNAEQDGLETTRQDVNTNFKRIFNITKDREANDILRRIGREKVNLGTFKNTEGKEVKLELTKGQMIDAYNLMQATENLPTFTEGNKFTPEMMDAIKNGLTTQEKAWADWQRSYLADYWTSINKVYETLYGVKLGRNVNYWPRNRDIERSDVPEHILVQEDYNHFASVTNGSLKARTQNKIPFKFLDANAKLVQHITQMEHFKAWAFTIRDLRSVFMSPEIKNAMRQFYGSAIGGKIDDYISVLARGGIEKAKRVHILDTLRGNVAVAQLGIKPMIAIKQPTALLAFATEMPYRDFVSGVVDFLKSPLANYKTLYGKSSSLRARYRAGQYERDIKAGVEGGAPKSISGKASWKERVLTLIQLGDQFGTVPGMWAKYKSELKAGATDAQAILEAEKLTNRTQNTSQLFTLTTIQHGGSWARLLTMFQDQPNKYFRLIDGNFRNMINGRQGKAKSISNIVLLWVVLPVLFQWMSDVFRWRPERQIRAALLGPVNMLLIFGQMAQSTVGWLTGEKFPYEPSPVLQIADDIQVAISKMQKLVRDGQDPFKEVSIDDVIEMIERFAKAGGLAAGVPTPYLVQVEKAIRAGKPIQLLWTEWALEDVQSLRDKLLESSSLTGQMKELDETAPDKIPGVYTTKEVYSKVKQHLTRTLPSTITAKEFSPQLEYFAQTMIAEDEMLTIPNKKLHEIVDDIQGDLTLNYTIMQYFFDWQTRSKIESLAKLKEFDSTHPRAYLGNITQAQLELLLEYEEQPDKKSKRQFIKEHPELLVNSRREWLKSHPDENAYLGISGLADIMTQEAYDIAASMIKDLGFSAESLSDFLPPKELAEPYFDFQDILEERDAQSWEAKLALAKNDDLRKWLKREPIETPIASLELKVKHRETFDRLESLSDKESPDYIQDEKARAEAVKKLKTPEFIDDSRRIEAYEKNGEQFVEKWVERGKLQDEREGFNAEDKLWLVDNPAVHKWALTNKLLTDEGKDWNIPALRIDAQYRKEDEEYNALPADGTARGDYLAENEDYRKDRRRREAHQLSNSVTGYKFPTDQVENFVSYNELSIRGKRRARMLLEDTAFGGAMVKAGQIANLPKPEDVPDVAFDDIYDQFPDLFDELEGLGKQEAFGGKYFKPTEEEREASRNELRFMTVRQTYSGISVSNKQLTEFGIAEKRREAYEKRVPGNMIDSYVGYTTVISQGKPKDWERMSKTDLWYEDDWYLIDNINFYKEVYVKQLGNERKDFRKVPSREVFRKYLAYRDTMKGTPRENYRFDNPDLDEWLVIKFGFTPISEKKRREGLTPLERAKEDIWRQSQSWDEQLKEIDKLLKGVR